MYRSLILSILAGVSGLGSARAEPSSTGKWLVDMGRDYALSPEVSGSNTDAEWVLLLMQAASRVDPELAEAWLWQYDLLSALGRPAEAMPALDRYVTLNPRDLSARLKWVDLKITAGQTLEARIETCRQLLADGSQPPELASDLHRRLGEYAYNRGDIPTARTHIGKSLEADRFNAHAWALNWLMSGQADSPEQRIYRLLTVMSVNPADMNAAWALANELRDLGLADQAREWYDHAARLSLLFSGKVPVELARDVRRVAPTTQPAGDRDQVKRWLEMFSRKVLAYPFGPEEFISVSIEPRSRQFGPTDPWLCRFELRNIGPVPVTLGADRMLNPELLCALETRGDKTRSTGPTIHIPLGLRNRLMPGESITVVQTVGVGPLRTTMISTPQVSHHVTLSAVLSPVTILENDDREVWTADVGGLVLEPVTFHRTSFVPTPSRLERVIAGTRAGSLAERITNLELLAMLLAEAENIEAGRLEYRARPIDSAVVLEAVLECGGDRDWRVRARLANCMRWFAPEDRARQLSARLVADPHWLVRGLALNMLAGHYGSQLVPTLQRLRDQDADAWVRDLCGALLAQAEASAANSAPADAQATQPAAPPPILVPQP